MRGCRAHGPAGCCGQSQLPWVLAIRERRGWKKEGWRVNFQG